MPKGGWLAESSGQCYRTVLFVCALLFAISGWRSPGMAGPCVPPRICPHVQARPSHNGKVMRKVETWTDAGLLPAIYTRTPMPPCHPLRNGAEPKKVDTTRRRTEARKGQVRQKFLAITWQKRERFTVNVPLRQSAPGASAVPPRSARPGRPRPVSASPAAGPTSANPRRPHENPDGRSRGLRSRTAAIYRLCVPA